MTRPTPKRTRKAPRPPKERAEEALAAAERRAKVLDEKVEAARKALQDLELLQRVASRRLEHARANPDLHDADDTELPFDDPPDAGDV